MNDPETLAAQNGFSHWAQLNMAAAVPLEAVRDMCASGRCGRYGHNWACPPGCGSIEAGIRVNAVAPGFIETEMLDQMTDAAKEAGKAQIPFGRYGKTEEIANTVAFLASEKASYITGQVICVDGGMAM